jgi:endonuclease YncB( thermonuclease family)
MKLRIPSIGLFSGFTLILILGLLCSGCTVTRSTGAAYPEALVPGVRYHALVTNVVDGDTFDVQFDGGPGERIRVLGVDTPETTPGNNMEGEYGSLNDTALLAMWGVQAENFARTSLEGKEVALELDRSAGVRDRYGRVLAYVMTPDGSDFGAVLLREGLARVYTAESFSRKDEYLRLEQAARTAGTGLWRNLPPATRSIMNDALSPLFPGPAQDTTPALLSGIPDSSSSPVYSGLSPDSQSIRSPGTTADTPSPSSGPYILDVVYNPPGDDRADPNGEYIVLTNAGPGEENLEGWRVREGGGVAFTFPRVSLPAGGTLALHTGKGTGDDTSLFWNRTAPLLNNDGDTVTLLDPSGLLVSTYSWGQ